MTNVVRRIEAKKRVKEWVTRFPWTTTTLYIALTWRNPVASGFLAVISVIFTSAAITLYRSSTLISLAFVSLAIFIGIPAVPLPSSRIAPDSSSSAISPHFNAAVDAGTAVLVTLGEWYDLAAQQWAMRPGAFTVQGVGTLLAAALALSHVPTSAIVWLVLCAVLTVPGCISTGALSRAQHAARPSVTRAQEAALHLIQHFENKVSSAVASSSSAPSAPPLPPRPTN